MDKGISLLLFVLLLLTLLFNRSYIFLLCILGWAWGPSLNSGSLYCNGVTDLYFIYLLSAFLPDIIDNVSSFSKLSSLFEYGEKPDKSSCYVLIPAWFYNNGVLDLPFYLYILNLLGVIGGVCVGVFSSGHFVVPVSLVSSFFYGVYRLIILNMFLLLFIFILFQSSF